MTDLQVLMQQIAKHFGYQVGTKVKAEIDKVVGAEKIDTDKLQAAIKTIEKLLDADPSTPEFDVGQNIITQLTDHLKRIEALENEVKTLNADAKTEGSVDYKVKAAKDALQAEIDKLKGDSTQSVADLQAELDAIEKGVGLDSKGNYVVDSKANYIAKATSVKNATEILDTELKNLADKHAEEVKSIEDEIKTTVTDLENKAAAAEKAAKEYADNQIKSEIVGVDVCVVVNMFAKAMDCGLQGKAEKDCAGDSCSNTSGNGSASGSASGDGAVV